MSRISPYLRLNIPMPQRETIMVARAQDLAEDNSRVG
jgi:hypothetical protein